MKTNYPAQPGAGCAGKLSFILTFCPEFRKGLDAASKKSYAEKKANTRKRRDKMEQKKVLALHDLSAVGRAGLTQAISALIAMGHQCIPLPTAVYSSHAGIPGFVTQDLTDWLSGALGQYEALGLRFDAVLSGFLSAPAQVECVRRAAACKQPNGILLVDPVMGDNGKLYKICTPELVDSLRQLCHMADYITPNVTEAAVLLDLPADTTPESMTEAEDWVHRLCERYETRTVLTGLGDETTVFTLCGQDDTVQTVTNPRIGAYYPGTGDLFAAVLTGSLLRGNLLRDAASCAANFVCECIRATAQMVSQPQWGVILEPQLWRLYDEGKFTGNCTVL